MRSTLDTLVQDLRAGARSLWRRPGFSASAILTLALGIGANTAVFSVIEHVLLAPLPYEAPDRTVVIWSKWRGFDKTWVSDAEATDYATRVSAFERAAAWSVGQVNLTGEGANPIRVGAAFVTPALFDVLGVRPSIGRTFTEAESQADTPTVAVISHGLWQRRFAGESVVGQSVTINGIAREVIGIMPKDFQLPTDYVVDAEEPTTIWLPYRLNPANRGSHGLYAAARLKDGVDVAQANAELKALAATRTSEGLYPTAMEFSSFVVTTTDEAVAAVRPALGLVWGAVGCLLLIACANVANLLLVGGESRAREMAVRVALGAKTSRLVRQMVTEVSVLAVAASAVGIAFAWVALEAIVASGLSGVPRVASVALDGRVLMFSALLTVFTLLAVALVPAFRSAHVSLVEAFKDGSAQASSGVRRQRLRGVLVVAETALAVALLVGASLMLTSLWNLQRIDLGFDPARVLTMRLVLPQATYGTPEQVNEFYAALATRVRALPGVERAGLLRLLPLAAPIGDWGLTVEGYTPVRGVGAPADWQVASAGGPEALGERLLAGRWLSDVDIAGAPDVALINQAMAQKYFAGRNPIGARFRMGNETRPWITVVGLVANVRHNGVVTEIKPKFYRAHGQFHLSTGNPARGMTLVAKTTGAPLTYVAAVRQEVRALDPNLPIAAIRTMDDVVATAIATPRLTGWLLGGFAAVALALAAIGIYGVLSFVVATRRQEIGIRMALGAGSASIIGLVARGALALSATGVVIGLGGAALATRLASSLLHGVGALDPVAYASAAVILLVVATMAAVVPAWRACRSGARAGFGLLK